MKKLFTLLTLLVAIVTGAWAQDPDISFTFESSTVGNYLKTYTIAGNNIVVGSSATSISSGNGGYYIDLGSTSSGFASNYLNVKAPSSVKIAKISVLATGSGNSKDIKAPVFGFAEEWDGSSTNADNVDYIEFVSATSNGGKFNTAEWYDVDVSNWDASEIRIYRSIKGITVTGESIKTSETVGNGQTLRVWGFKVWLKAGAPVISAHPVGATYADGDPIAPLTVTATASAGELSYQWYSCDDEAKTNAAAIDGATSASYTPTAAGFYYVNVKDDNGDVNSNVAQIDIEAATAPTISIAAGGSTTVTAGTSITLTATATGVPGPDIQWYVSDTNDTSAGTAISGATESTYTFDAVAGTKYYYATASNKVQSDVASNVVTVTAAARTGYTLNQVVFSNSFDAFITAPVAAVYYTQEEIDAAQEGDEAYGKTTEDIKTPAVAASIKAYYMAGTEAPTVSSVNMSPGATYSIEGNTLTVMSEDGQTSVAYPITLGAVTPYDGAGVHVFDGTETWVKTGNAFSTTSGKEGWVFSKNDSDWSRETPGKNRIYFFLAPATTVTFANGGTARNIKVYKNGTQLSAPTSTSSCTIEGDGENNFMIAIVSNQTSGDGALKSISTPIPASIDLTINAAAGATTVYSDYALDFSEVAATAYVEKGTGDKLEWTAVETAPAKTGLLVVSSETALTVPTAASSTTDVTGNRLKGVATGESKTVVDGDNIYIFTLHSGKPGFFKSNVGRNLAAGKAYLDLGEATGAREFFALFEDDTTTGISSIDNGQLTIDNDAPAYNLAGQKVSKSYKGIVIINGKKVVK